MKQSLKSALLFICVTLATPVYAETVAITSCKDLSDRIPDTTPKVIRGIDSCVEINSPEQHAILAIVSFNDAVRGSSDETLQNTWAHNVCGTFTGSSSAAQKKVSLLCNHNPDVLSTSLSFTNLEGIFPCPMAGTDDERSWGFSSDPAGGVSGLICSASAPDLTSGVELQHSKAWLFIKLPSVKGLHLFGKIRTGTKSSVKGVKVTLKYTSNNSTIETKSNAEGNFRFDLMDGTQYIITPRPRNRREAFSPSKIKGTIRARDINKSFLLIKK